MIKLSSGFTILFKFFLPIFWVVFFGSLLVALLTLPGEDIYMGPAYLKYILIGSFVGWTLLLYFTIFKLKRVEGSREGLFISNYFKHILIPFEDIEDFQETNLGLFLLIKVRFNRKTYFGKKIYFLGSHRRFGDFVQNNADRFAS